ncbi:MAG TPA: glycoside hydrolase family 2 TIM barrel-domain containing protein [Thermoleophilaceae bacterium]
MKRAVLAISAALVVAAGAAPASAQTVTTPSPGGYYAGGHTGRYLLDGPWLFRRDTTSAWTQITVPNAWNATDESVPSMRGGIGWYRKDFRLPSTAKGTSWIVRFESVNYRATVYLNGHLLGRHEGGYIPFEFDLARYLKRGKNTLLVRADSHRNLSTLPILKTTSTGLPSSGWWNYGGILREVYLRRVYKVDMEELLARPLLPCRACAASVLVQAALRNMTSKRQKVTVRASVGSQRVRLPSVVLPSHGTVRLANKVGIRSPRLWEPGSPNLYAVSAAALVGRREATGWSAQIGIRSIRVNSSGRVLLNGNPVMLRGASFHEEDVTVGAALTPEMRSQMWQQLRGLDANFTRAHYPLHPWFLEQADRDGILVWDEIPMYQTPNSITAKASVRRKALNYLADTVARDENHPSVLAWAIGNEMPTRVGGGQQRYIRDAASMLRKIDPTRLRALDYAGYPNALPSSTYHVLDALGVNCYFGWYPGPGGQIDDRAELAPFLDQVHRYYPSKALFVTEFGAEANRNGPLDEKGTYNFQRQLVEDHLAVYDSKPFVNGALVWALRDFRVRPEWDGGNPKPASPLNQKGLLDQFGKPKPAYAAVKRMFDEVDPLQRTAPAARR